MDSLTQNHVQLNMVIFSDNIVQSIYDIQYLNTDVIIYFDIILYRLKHMFAMMVGF